MRLHETSRVAVVTAAVLVGGQMNALGDLGPPVRISMPAGTAPAVARQPYAGVFEIQLGEGGTLADFELAGDGWTVYQLDVPEQRATAGAGVIRVPFRAMPTNPDQPLRLTFTYNGKRVSKAYELGPAYFQSVGRDQPLVRIADAELADMITAVPAGQLVRPANVSGGAIPLRFTGRFMYTRPVSTDGNGNFIGSVDVGVDHIWVEVMDDDGLASDALVDESVWSGRTDDNGYFDSGVIWWDDCDEVGCDEPDLYVRFECDTGIAQVQDSGVTEEDYSWSTMDNIHENFTGSEINFGTVKPADSALMPALHIWNSIVRAHRFIQSEIGIDVPIVDVQWPETEDGAWYVSFYEEIHIGPDRQWNEGTHIHEYGHHFLENFSVNTTPDYCNGFCDSGDCGHCRWCQETDHDAWNEGWPSWLADVVTRSFVGDYEFDDCTPYTALIPRDTEDLDTCQVDGLWHDPWLTEGYASALLRDIEDEADDAHDPNDDDNHGWGNLTDCLALGVDEIFTVVVNDQPNTPWQFLQMFQARYPQHRAGLWKTAQNVHPDFLAAFPPDTAPPGAITSLDSISHPIGTGGPLPCITVAWEQPFDDVSGTAGFSVAWTTNANGTTPDTTINWGGSCVSRATSPPKYADSDHYVSIRARDNDGRWGPTSTFGPFTITDCNDNGVMDLCETSCTPDGAFAGCFIPVTFCDPFLACGTAPDCNGNGVPDECDLAANTSEDCNRNGVPDECENVVYWVSGGGSWHDASNWDKPGMCGAPPPCAETDQCPLLPVDNDDVCIRDPEAAIAVGYSADTLVIGTLACEESLAVQGGSFPWADLVVDDPSWVEGDLTLSGNLAKLTVNDGLNVGGTFHWGGSTQLIGPSTTNVNGGMELSGISQLIGHTLAIGNLSTAVSDGRVDFSSGAVIHVRSGAFYNHRSIYDVFSGGGTEQFVNEGTFIKSQETGNSVISISTENSGLIHVQSGTLALARGSTSTGSFLADSGTTLVFRGGGHHTQVGSSITAERVTFESGIGGTNTIRGSYNVSDTTTQRGQDVTFASGATIINYGPTFLIPRGLVNFNAIVGDTIHFDTLSLGTPINAGGTANFNSGDPVEVTELTIGPGAIGGPSDVAVTGTLTWRQSGHFRGSGELNVNGPMNVESGGGAKSLRDRTLNNTGYATFLGGIGMETTAVFNNLPTGTIDIQADGGIFALSTTALLNNEGTLIKSAGSGSSEIASHFVNRGRVEIQTGDLYFDGSYGLTYQQLAGETVLNGGSLTISTTSYDLHGGSLTGAGTVTGRILNIGGHLEPGLSPGVLTIVGTYAQGVAGGYLCEIGGLTPGTDYDVFEVTGPASLDGLLDIRRKPGYTPVLGEIFDILTTTAGRSGVFAQIANRAIGDGLRFDPVYSATGVSLIVAEAIAGDGDLTDNGLTDLEDWPALMDCLEGPDTPHPPGCEAADMDGDGDVDLDDMGLFDVALEAP